MTRMILPGPGLVLALFLTISSLQAAEPDLSPSEAVTLMNHMIKFQPEAERTTITAPLMSRMHTEDFSEIERFFKGEAHFLNFEPEPARDAFWAFRERDDDLGRVALQRLMIIRINAFGMADEIVEKDIPWYRERFPIDPQDRYGISYPLSQTARHLIENGNAELGLNLIVEEVKRHDQFDSPYIAYTLPGQFIEAASAQGRGEEFIDLHNWVLEGLTASVEKRLNATVTEAEPVMRLPGEVFFSLFTDGDLDHYQWTAELMRLRDRLKRASEEGA